ncbi:MAG: TerB family tellurite resistance protein [Kiloniellaceae bacterium]
MEPSLREKLVTEVRRYQNRDFLKAAMAVCALAAVADDEVKLSERYRIDHAIATEPALRVFDADKAVAILDDYIFALRQEGESAKKILYKKVRRMAGDYKMARTLMRVAYLIITADEDIREEEMQEFGRLCRLLDLDPNQIWRDLAR